MQKIIWIKKVGTREVIITTNHPLYSLRYGIMTRCYNAPQRDFPYYQGRGVIMCDEWKNNAGSFFDWCLKNGWKKGLVLDRIDSKKDYSPDNCQFITKEANLSKMHLERNTIGENAGNVKLTEEKVRAIKDLIDRGVTLTRIAKDFNVAPSTISAIKLRKNWKHI